MDCFNDPLIWVIVLKWAAQSSKTEGIILNSAGYFIDQDPAHILIVEPREYDAKKTSRRRLAPMIRDTPCLRDKVSDPVTRDTGNTILTKEFPGGSVTLAGANAPAGLAGDPIRILLLNEVSRFPPSAGAEGDPVSIAEARTTTFSNRKIAMNSSPTDAGICRISKAYEDSDQRKYYVPCPHCGVMQTLRWAQVKWDKDERGNHRPETAHYECEDCGKIWTEAQRHEAVRQGEWIASKPTNGIAGFHLNALYAPWVNLSLPNLAARWLRAQGKPLMLKAFINTVLAEEYHERYKAIDDTGLMARREKYPERDGVVLVPHDVVIMTAGVDIQDDRIEVQIVGTGLDDESWRLQYHVLDGDPSSRAVWDDLWSLLCRPLPMARGGADYIRSTCVDTGGHHTQKAYEFCRPRARVITPDGRRSFVFAIKGRGQDRGDIWVRTPSRKNIGKVPLYTVRVDPAKEELMASLQQNVEPGPGYIHFPIKVSAGKAFDDEYFKQLTSEVCVIDADPRGHERRIWKLKSEARPNEALDTHNYARAAVQAALAMGMNIEREAKRNAVAAEISGAAEFGGPAGAHVGQDGFPQEQAVATPARPRRRTRRRWKSANL